MIFKIFLCVIFVVSVMQISVAKVAPGKSPFTELVDHYDHGKRITSVKDATPKIAFTFPGTKWCGPGSTADNYEDLGTAKATDMCCRTHDYCDNILAGETKHNLTNNGLYTKLHCDCDRDFYICLKKAGTITAESVGSFYFNTFPTKCYMESFPITSCSRYQYLLFIKRCIEYKMDFSKPLQWQWFDLPLFK